MGGKALNGQRIPLEQAEQFAKEITEQVKQVTENGVDVYVAGSIRRQRPTCGDVDFVVAPRTVIGRELFDRWCLRTCGRLKNKKPARSFLYKNVQVEFNVCHREAVGAMLLHCTGSMIFNIRCRNAAIASGMSLNQYGLWRKAPDGGAILVQAGDEEYILDAIGIERCNPQYREK